MFYALTTLKKRKIKERHGKDGTRNDRVTNEKKSYLKYVLAATVEHRGAHDGSRHVLSISHKNTLELVLM